LNGDTSYSVVYQQIDQGSPQETTRNWTTGGGFLRKKTYHTQVTTIQGLKDYYTNSIKADNPISISILTPSASAPAPAGSLAVNSAGSLSLPKGVKNASSISIATSGTADLSLQALQVKDSSIPIYLDSAGDLNLQVGGASSSSAAHEAAASVASSAAVSRASTAVSRVRVSPNPRLGVTSLTNSPSHQLNRQVSH
jgi:hypothetical protein